MRALTLSLLGTVLFALVACGGDDDGALSREEFTSRANAICAEYERRIDEIAQPDNFDQLVTYAGEARNALDEGLAELGELEPPDDLAAKYEQWLASGQQASERIGEIQQAARQEDQREINRIFSSAERDEAESDRLARDLGLDECADD